MQNAVEFLSQARHIDVQINSKLEELHSLKAMAEKVTTTYQSDMVDGSRDVHKREGIICKIIDLQNEINSDIDQLVDLKISIRQIIESLPDMEGRTVLNLRYVRLLKWQEVADTMGYSLRRVHNFHDRAIQYLESEIE
jgi:DNA-directed RNA polymerase specialized sigma subunit